MNHVFTLEVSGIDPTRDGYEDALFDAGCDDALIAVIDNTLYLDFDQDAPSFEAAVEFGEAGRGTRRRPCRARDARPGIGGIVAWLFRQAPAPRGGGLVKPAWFRRYLPPELPAAFDRLAQSWDTASKPAPAPGSGLRPARGQAPAGGERACRFQRLHQLGHQGVTTRKCSECTTSGTLSELRPPVEIAAAAAL